MNSILIKANNYQYYKVVSTLVESSSIEASSMHTNMLLLNPPWTFIILFIFHALYTVRKGIARNNYICELYLFEVINGINI